MTYVSMAPISALLQQINGERLLNQPMTPNAKKHMTAAFTAIERTCRGIITSCFAITLFLHISLILYVISNLPQALAPSVHLI